MTIELPNLPWQKVATDLFHWKTSTYLLLNYYSRYIEISKLNEQSSSEVICHTKSIFARHGIPQEVVSDNGPSYSSLEYKQFAAQYGFTHTTSSPRYPQNNGEAERAVKTVKSFLKKSDDPYLALLIYRSTPLHNGFSPSELLMSRQLRTTLPMLESQLQPSVPEYSVIHEKETMRKANIKRNFDVRHRANILDPLLPGQQVWISGSRDSGVIVEQSQSPRSYIVSTPTGDLRRNRRQLTPIPDSENSDTRPEPQETVHPQQILLTKLQEVVGYRYHPTD